MHAHGAGKRLLRLTEHAESTSGRYRIEVALEGAGPRRTTTVQFALSLTPRDRADLRWYLEDYLLFPIDPAPQIAARIEKRIAEIGDDLFRSIFHATDDARDLWADLRNDLDKTRVEVITAVRHAASVPWELLRDPKTQTPLAIRAKAFVRAHPTSAERPRGAPATGAGRIRILLVICRPRGGADVPFRSVASRLLKGLGAAARDLVQLDVLRPPTFDMLGRMLRAAKDRGEPYHVVHFDGHGAYLDEDTKTVADVLSGVNAHVLGCAREGAHGYLVFESPEEAAKDRGQLVDGPSLGKLLVETAVPVLVLNACRSAHADSPEKPDEAGDSDVGGDVASFGSLALEVMHAGVSGVVAMRYNVYVVTAAQFVADLYAALAGGLALGEAVSRGRKQLHDQPLRAIAYDSCKLQDWLVPVVYEAEPIPLFPTPGSSPAIKLSLDAKADDDRALVGVPAAPDAGFFGRDETLLALDRAFDQHAVVLLHAYAGSGKSTAAAEFARWYARTRGVDGPVLWTSFERRMPLAQAIEVLACAFEPALKQNGIEWLALDDGERRRIALQLLKQTDVLWVWDNVEPVAGFPAGTASAWSSEEQREIVDFLREARATKAKFLLTSRRDEQAWLGELPARVQVPPMPLQERVQLARALAGKRGARLDEVKDWKPLLAFTQGNPMAITVLVGQALRDGLNTKEQVAAFVAQLRAGEAAFTDEANEGRLRSLGASLSYGFANAFTDHERCQLALLHLFQDYVNVGVLCAMGTANAECCVPEIWGLTHENAQCLLDRAAEIGLLTAVGRGYYMIHPALPWFLREMFDRYHGASRVTGNDHHPAARAVRAYVESMSALGNHHIKAYDDGVPEMVDRVRVEEANLLSARAIARERDWWMLVIGTMQGLRTIYEHSGMVIGWARLVDELVPDLVDPQTEGPLPGRDEPWLMLTGYRAAIAGRRRRLDEAERLQRLRTRYCRMRADTICPVSPGLDPHAKNLVHSLIVALEQLGIVQRDRRSRDCLATFDEALDLATRLGDRKEMASLAVNIGYVFTENPGLRNLRTAEEWFRRGLDLVGHERPHDRAKVLGAIGQATFQRAMDLYRSYGSKQEPLAFANLALASLQESLALLADDATRDRAIVHQMAGIIFGHGPERAPAELHLSASIRCFEEVEDLHGAGVTRLHFARCLRSWGELVDARSYGHAALRNFETFGERAANETWQTRELLGQIDALLANGPS